MGVAQGVGEVGVGCDAGDDALSEGAFAQEFDIFCVEFEHYICTQRMRISRAAGSSVRSVSSLRMTARLRSQKPLRAL